MNNFVSYFIIIFLILCGYIYVEGLNNEVIYVKSTLDNNEYLVRNLEDKLDAANLMAQMKKRLLKLQTYLEEYHSDEKRVKRFIKKFNPDNITESTKNNKYTSYSINKGEKIVFCIRSRDDQEKLIDINTLMFVALHELAHIMTVSIGHTEEFWNNFKFILNKATAVNVYSAINYSKNPQKYCGITITDSPLYN